MYYKYTYNYGVYGVVYVAQWTRWLVSFDVDDAKPREHTLQRWLCFMANASDFFCDVGISVADDADYIALTPAPHHNHTPQTPLAAAKSSAAFYERSLSRDWEFGWRLGGSKFSYFRKCHEFNVLISMWLCDILHIIIIIIRHWRQRTIHCVHSGAMSNVCIARSKGYNEFLLNSATFRCEC